MAALGAADDAAELALLMMLEAAEVREAMTELIDSRTEPLAVANSLERDAKAED